MLKQAINNFFELRNALHLGSIPCACLEAFARDNRKGYTYSKHLNLMVSQLKVI